MMPDIQKILYATDLSKNAAYAFRYATYLAKNLDAEIVILHVIEKMSPDAQIALQAYLDIEDRKKMFKEKIGNAVDRIEKRLNIFCEKELQGDPACRGKIATTIVREGYPAEEILMQADRLNCDAIVMGAHEKGFTHTFLGSVAKSVLRRSRKPAFIVPLPRGEIDLSFDE
jgi:nucleotide-binding universal stress UspA family protein